MADVTGHTEPTYHGQGNWQDRDWLQQLMQLRLQPPVQWRSQPPVQWLPAQWQSCLSNSDSSRSGLLSVFLSNSRSILFLVGRGKLPYLHRIITLTSHSYILPIG